jgi:hypothetical protein
LLQSRKMGKASWGDFSVFGGQAIEQFRGLLPPEPSVRRTVPSG